MSLIKAVTSDGNEKVFSLQHFILCKSFKKCSIFDTWVEQRSYGVRKYQNERNSLERFIYTHKCNIQYLFTSFGDKKVEGWQKTLHLYYDLILYTICIRFPQKFLLNFSQIKMNITALIFKIKKRFLLDGSQKTFTVCDMQYH
jgi:hypothetical protein